MPTEKVETRVQELTACYGVETQTAGEIELRG